MKKTATVDIAIFGGGIAGLWLLDRLRQAGYSAVLLESGTLGGGQTNKAQGIIHGGMKYALQGILTNEANSMVDLPKQWGECLAGVGEIDLRHVPILSTNQYLWASSKLTAKLAGFFASAALASQVKPLQRQDYPSIFQNPGFKGEVFALDEIVIDVPALVRELVKLNQDIMFRIEPLCEEELHFDEQGKLHSATVYMSGNSIDIKAQHYIFTAGAGNELITKKLEYPGLQMQRRPLHMVLAKVPFNYPVYAHCLGMGARPRLTITTHTCQDGSSVWYLGGMLAEEGVGRDSQAQIQAARVELSNLFPWLDFNEVEFATFMIDRAEPQQKSGLKPESCFAKVVENITVAWPTKLALAPKLAQDILTQLQQSKITPHFFDTQCLRAWPMPCIARPIWEDMFCKNDS